MAPPGAALRADPTVSEISDGVPVSLLIRNDGHEDDRLLGGSTPVAERVALRRTLIFAWPTGNRVHA
ncbi:MAG TPA: hypothetical protein VHG52_14165 [Thermomicrobiales bacterium]|nr:hypothetical protein [Thermomicrobiales bacterium]